MAESRNLTVLHVVDQLALGGAERMAVDFVNLLPAHGVKTLLCSTRLGGPLEKQVAAGVECILLNRRSRLDLGAARRLIDLVRERKIDIIHSHGIGSMYFVAACRLLGALRCKHLFHNHRPDINVNSPVPLSMKLAARGGFDIHVGVDQNLCDWIEKRVGVPASKVFMIRNGIDIQRFANALPAPVRETFQISPATVVFVMIANFRPEKDHPNLFRALAQCERRNGLKVLLIGVRSDTHAEYYETCVRMVADLGLEDAVEFVGIRDDVPNFLLGCDAAVHSARDESGPLALLEHMAAGLPYVVTDRGQVTQAVKGTGSGIVVPPQDPQALAEGIDSLCALEATDRRRMGSIGKQLVSRQFSQEATVRQIVDLYRKLVTESDRGIE